MESAFQFCAAVAFLGTGWFIDRIGLSRGFAIGVAVWSIAGMAHAFATTVAGFIGSRMVLGAAESIGTPAQVKTAATYFSAKDRSMALGIGNTAPNVGAVLTPLAIPPLASWLRVAGGVSPGRRPRPRLGRRWLPVKPDGPAAASAAHVRPRAVAQPARNRRQWTVVAAKVLSDQVWFFMLAWLPDLFHRMFGMSQGQLGLPVALVYLMAAGGALTGGWLPTKLMAMGWSTNRARKDDAAVRLPRPARATGGLSGDAWTAALLLGLGLFAHQGFSTNVFGLATDILPARAARLDDRHCGLLRQYDRDGDDRGGGFLARQRLWLCAAIDRVQRVVPDRPVAGAPAGAETDAGRTRRGASGADGALSA